MNYTDTATHLMRAETRFSPAQFHKANDVQVNKLYEGEIIKVTIAETFESSVFVYVYNLKDTYIASAGVYSSASSATSTGSHRPFFKGDKVLVQFISGDASRPIIVNRMFTRAGCIENMLETGNPLPEKNKVTKSGQVIQPNVLASEPEAFKNAGLLSVDVHPLLLI